MASITRSTTTSTGWRSSAIPSSSSHATAARLYTLIVMRAAAADVVPLKFVPYGLALREHVDELRRIQAQRVRKSDDLEAGRRDRFRRVCRAWSRPSARSRPRPSSSTGRPRSAGRRDEHARRRAWPKLNDALAKVERAFLLEKGLPGRPWFKHAVYAPGLTTGYAAWPLPAIRQAPRGQETGRELWLPTSTRTVERIKKRPTAALETPRQHGAARSIVERDTDRVVD